jgi:hypothetical protein
VQVNTRVDPNLLGGLIVKLGSRMIDSSLRMAQQSQGRHVPLGSDTIDFSNLEAQDTETPALSLEVHGMLSATADR